MRTHHSGCRCPGGRSVPVTRATEARASEWSSPGLMEPKSRTHDPAGGGQNLDCLRYQSVGWIQSSHVAKPPAHGAIALGPLGGVAFGISMTVPKRCAKHP